MKSASANETNYKRVYNSALTGAYFGIFNVFYVFIPFLTYVKDKPSLFITYIIAGLLILSAFICVPVFFKKQYRYDIIRLRYLLFLGVFSLTFYSGLAICLFFSFSGSSFFINFFVMLLYAVLSVMTSLDILSSASTGFNYIRRLYTRTYKKHLFYNIIISLSAIFIGIALLLPQILY